MMGHFQTQAKMRTILSLIMLSLSLFLAYGWYTQYYIRRACFNEMGRCLEPETGVIYLEQSGAIWLSLAVLAFAITVWLGWRSRRA
ncbi:hypothetical protein A8B83_06530 [Rhodobacteraceae bacterium EhC02]|nr:hypothetical protein A8B83_06530 [Rhodobacteraceae bacterium EhC02]